MIVRKIICLALFVGMGLPSQAQMDFVFPDLDKSLIKLWLSCNTSQPAEINKALNVLSEEWPLAKQYIEQSDVPYFDMNLLIKDLDQLIVLMKRQSNKRNFKQLQSYTYHFLWEFRSIRQCSYNLNYPLDQLFDSYDLYKEIKYTIEDPMFGLREWSDFENLVNDFVCTFEAYDLIHQRQLLEYFPGIDIASHKESKLKMADCIHNLILSFESGYQSDYGLPCDELGTAIIDVFRTYARSQGRYQNFPKGQM